MMTLHYNQDPARVLGFSEHRGTDDREDNEHVLMSGTHLAFSHGSDITKQPCIFTEPIWENAQKVLNKNQMNSWSRQKGNAAEIQDQKI